MHVMAGGRLGTLLNRTLLTRT